MMEKLKNNKGFTLIELLVGLAISCIVIVAAYSFVLAGLKSYDMSKKTTDFQEETQFVENIIGDAVENGDMNYTSITTDAATGDVKFDTGNQVLVFAKSAGSLYVYNKGETIDLTDTDDALSHLASKNVDSFSAAYVLTEKETNADGSDKTALSPGEKSELVEVTVEVTKDGKSRTSKKQYKFRNLEKESESTT